MRCTRRPVISAKACLGAARGKGLCANYAHQTAKRWRFSGIIGTIMKMSYLEAAVFSVFRRVEILRISEGWCVSVYVSVWRFAHSVRVF